MKIALIQINSIPEKPETNLKKIISFSIKAKDKGADLAIFHEGTLTDYVEDIEKYAQSIPDGKACTQLSQLSERLRMFISFGLIEKENYKRYISQVFLGPNHYFHVYRKTWLYYTKQKEAIKRFRNEIDFFDPGTGISVFKINNIKAACMICNDGNSKKCRKDMRRLKPEIIFFPNNRAHWRSAEYWGDIAKECKSPLFVINRVGHSWGRDCIGGCSVYSAKGELLAEANKEGREEIIIFDTINLLGK